MRKLRFGSAVMLTLITAFGAGLDLAHAGNERNFETAIVCRPSDRRKAQVALEALAGSDAAQAPTVVAKGAASPSSAETENAAGKRVMLSAAEFKIPAQEKLSDVLGLGEADVAHLDRFDVYLASQDHLNYLEITGLHDTLGSLKSSNPRKFEQTLKKLTAAAQKAERAPEVFKSEVAFLTKESQLTPLETEALAAQAAAEYRSALKKALENTGLATVYGQGSIDRLHNLHEGLLYSQEAIFERAAKLLEAGELAEGVKNMHLLTSKYGNGSPLSHFEGEWNKLQAAASARSDEDFVATIRNAFDGFRSQVAGFEGKRIPIRTLSVPKAAKASLDSTGASKLIQNKGLTKVLEDLKPRKNLLGRIKKQKEVVDTGNWDVIERSDPERFPHVILLKNKTNGSEVKVVYAKPNSEPVQITNIDEAASKYEVFDVSE